MNNQENIKIDLASGHFDELYGYWFTCPKCKDHNRITHKAKFCPNCGIEITWIGNAPSDIDGLDG